MRQAYTEALARGKEATRRLTSKRPRMRLTKPRISLPGRKKRALPAAPPALACANCGKPSAADARFCQYCGHAFD
jgi:hypothetical protein